MGSNFSDITLQTITNHETHVTCSEIIVCPVKAGKPKKRISKLDLRKELRNVCVCVRVCVCANGQRQVGQTVWH